MQLLVSFFFFLIVLMALIFFFQVLRESLHITSKYLTQEAKVVSLTFRMEALEAENSTLKKKLIDSMDKATTSKAKVKTLNDDLRA